MPRMFLEATDSHLVQWQIHNFVSGMGIHSKSRKILTFSMSESVSKQTESYTGSYFGVVSIRQGMQAILVILLVASIFEVIPSIAEVGYRCEMYFAGSSGQLSSFSQVLCWLSDSIKPWEICRFNSLLLFSSEFVDELALFFGLVLISSPKPHIPYVLLTRYLIMFSTIESLTRLVYRSLVYWGGNNFLSSAGTCAISHVASDEMVQSESLREIIFEIICLLLYTAYIWGTFVLVPILRRGGTGDEKVADSDVLALIRVSPPKLLVIASGFGFGPLRTITLLLSCVLFGISSFSLFGNIYRMTYWCGYFPHDSSWCIWPYGITSLVDQGLCLGGSIMTIIVVLQLSSDRLLGFLKIFWSLVSVLTLGFLGWSLYIVSEHYPAYWFDGMKEDVWSLYVKFWISLILVVFISSMSVVRIAGGTGAENETDAWSIIHENLSEEVIDEHGDDNDPLSDLLGMRDPLEESKAPSRVVVNDSTDDEEEDSGIENIG